MIRPFLNDKFTHICNADVQVDSSLFGTDFLKKMKDFGDYTKFPIAYPKYKYGKQKPGNNSYFINKDLNYRGPA